MKIHLNGSNWHGYGSDIGASSLHFPGTLESTLVPCAFLSCTCFRLCLGVFSPSSGMQHGNRLFPDDSEAEAGVGHIIL